MLMSDHPRAVNLAVACGRTHPHPKFPSIGRRSAVSVKAMAEGHVIARRNTEVADLVADGALERREPLLRAFSLRISSAMVQWVDDIEQEYIWSDALHRPVDVLGVDCLDTSLDERPDLSFITCFALCCGHIFLAFMCATRALFSAMDILVRRLPARDDHNMMYAKKHLLSCSYTSAEPIMSTLTP